MLKLVMLCVLGLAVGQQNGNTRFLGQALSSIAGGLLGGGHDGVHGGLQGGVHGGLLDGVHGGGHSGVHGGGHSGVHGQSSSCRYWCRTPQGQAYCCENASKPPSPVGTKPGNCPIVRSECPPTRINIGPQTCSNDYSCAGSDKCCYDTCLGEHVCKPPEYPFGGR